MAFYVKEMLEEQDLTVQNDDETMVEEPENEDGSKTLSAYKYSSNVAGQYIRNAISGFSYPYHVGSHDELRLWKVTDTTCFDGSRDPKFYYYDSPHEAERHRGCKIDKKSIDNWRERQKQFADKDKSS